MDLPDLDKPCLYPGDSLTPWPQHKGIEALKALLPKIRYKKGWHFRLEPITYHSDYLDLDNFRNAASGSTHRLTIHYIAPDAYAPDEPRAQQFTVMIPNTNGYPYGDDMLPCPDEDAWARWLFRIIVYLEETRQLSSS